MDIEIDIFALAHEIKNPLAISLGYLEMSNKENFMKYKNLIESNINEALTILDSYLEYNKLVLDLDIMDIVMLLEDVKCNYQNLLKVNITLTTIYDELYINGDFCKLKQVFNNLVKNSIEANAMNINIYLKVVNKDIIINLVDDGDGFDDPNNIKVGYSSKVNGNGMGLRMINKIIDLHQGSINYQNNDNNGSNIIVKLPLKL